MIRRALEAQSLRALRFQPLAQRAQDAALADTRLARQHHHLTLAVFGLRPAAKQQIQFLYAAHQGGQRAVATMRVEAAIRHQGPFHSPGAKGFRDALQVLLPKIVQFKRLADQSTGRLRDDNLVSGGQCLQTCGQIGRATHRGDRLGGAGLDLAASDDQTGCDPNTHVQGDTCCGREPRQRFDERKAGLDGALGVMLVRLRITEIGQHAVSRVVGEVAMVAFNDICAASVTSGCHLPEVVQIEVGREHRQISHAASHNR